MTWSWKDMMLLFRAAVNRLCILSCVFKLSSLSLGDCVQSQSQSGVWDWDWDELNLINSGNCPL